MGGTTIRLSMLSNVKNAEYILEETKNFLIGIYVEIIAKY